MFHNEYTTYKLTYPLRYVKLQCNVRREIMVAQLQAAPKPAIQIYRLKLLTWIYFYKFTLQEISNLKISNTTSTC